MPGFSPISSVPISRDTPEAGADWVSHSVGNFSAEGAYIYSANFLTNPVGTFSPYMVQTAECAAGQTASASVTFVGSEQIIPERDLLIASSASWSASGGVTIGKELYISAQSDAIFFSPAELRDLYFQATAGCVFVGSIGHRSRVSPKPIVEPPGTSRAVPSDVEGTFTSRATPST
jgi:hypothetical protein